MSAELLANMVVTATAIMGVGLILSAALFKFDVPRFLASPLFIKIVLWLPIFAIFIATLYYPLPTGTFIAVLVVGISLGEALRTAKTHDTQKIYIALYWCAFIAAFGHFYTLALLGDNLIFVLITICFGSVMSDVTAFFFGKYLGRHALPSTLNSNKSWEGAVGQVAGAGLGVFIVNAFIAPVPWPWIFLPIGIGSALGDLTNSFVKRRLGIKDWGNSLPGHGGFLDRLASLAGAVCLSFYFLLLA